MARSSLHPKKGATRPIIRDVGQDDVYQAAEDMIREAAIKQAPQNSYPRMGANVTSGIKVRGALGGGVYDPIITKNQV